MRRATQFYRTCLEAAHKPKSRVMRLYIHNFTFSTKDKKDKADSGIFPESAFLRNLFSHPQLILV